MNIIKISQQAFLLSLFMFLTTGCEQKPPDFTAARWDGLVVHYCEGAGPDVVQYKWETRDAAALMTIQAAYNPSKFEGLSTMFNSSINELQIEINDEVFILSITKKNLGVIHKKGEDHPVHGVHFPDTHLHDTLQQILIKETGRDAHLLYHDEVNVTSSP